MIAEYFDKAVQEYGNEDFILAPARSDRAYYDEGYKLSYQAAAFDVERIVQVLAKAGYGHGHRIAIMLGNRPEMLLFKLACNQLGISWVPVNPDYRAAEISYLLTDSQAVLAITAPEYQDLMQQGLTSSLSGISLCLFENIELLTVFDAPNLAPYLTEPIGAETESSLIYTSGTTGKPKGCIMSHEYELMMGEWYCGLGGLVPFVGGHTRVYCPLPLFHVNAAILLFFAVIKSGSCQIIPERFSARHWWPDIVNTRATSAHYLGIIIPALMNQPAKDSDQDHGIEWAVGAGVEPTLHHAFEERFGFPLVEVWGMTEMCRLLADHQEPRQVATRAIGRSGPGLEVRVVDADDVEVPRGMPGEMTLRYSSNMPEKGAFSGYLNLPEETEKAWRGGWFHTGDTVTMDADNMIYFVDRMKNIIRRSGENIAAAEIEACLQDHPAVERVAVIAVPDDMRDEEVMACIQLSVERTDNTPKNLFDWCYERLSYYKAPGWIVFVNEVPVTGTQKVQKHALFAENADPTENAHDFRAFKKR
jgi:crotonobetaine/carnitine-CoA ligase